MCRPWSSIRSPGEMLKELIKGLGGFIFIMLSFKKEIRALNFFSGDLYL